MIEKKDKLTEDFITFLVSLNEAEKEGKHEYECPLCGGTVHWDRVKLNNHIHAYCDKCGIRVRE